VGIYVPYPVVIAESLGELGLTIIRKFLSRVGGLIAWRQEAFC
jgi:hypothetical protein